MITSSCMKTHTRLTALCRGLARWASTRKVKPIWILLEQETVSGSGISWAICKSAPRSRQTTTSAPHCSVFYRLDALPVAQPTVPKHWRHSEYTQHTHPFNITISFWGIQLTRWNTLSQNDSFSFIQASLYEGHIPKKHLVIGPLRPSSIPEFSHCAFLP